VKGWLFLSAPGAAVGKLMQMDQSGRKATLGPLAKHIEEAIEQLKPDLVALDPYIKAHGLPESDNALMDMVALATPMAAPPRRAPHGERPSSMSPEKPKPNAVR
jgi:hypothetical protein